MRLSGASLASTKQSGLSLVEIMIALLVGLFLIAGLGTIFLASKQTYRLNESGSRLQENGRFVIDKIETHLRSAGYAGCYGDLSVGVQNVLNDQGNLGWSLTNPVHGFDNVAANATLGSLATSSIAGTDVLVVKGMSGGVALATNPDTATFTIAATNNRFKPGEILLVADCDQASLFQASAVNTVGVTTTILHTNGGMIPGNNIAAVNNLFGAGAEIGRLQATVYFIQNGANGRPALFERSLEVSGGNTAMLVANELVQNVENMQILYGIDTDNDKDTDSYQNAAAITNWRNVISVQIALLLSSDEDNVLSAGETYTFNNTTFTYDKTVTGINRRFRHVFTGFIALRNRAL